MNNYNIITLVGISLFSNSKDYSKSFIDKAESYKYSEKDEFNEQSEGIECILAKINKHQLAKNCAEVDSILNIIKQVSENESSKFKISLICTDTILSYIAASAIKSYLETYEPKCIEAVYFTASLVNAGGSIVGDLRLPSSKDSEKDANKEIMDKFLSTGFDNLFAHLNRSIKKDKDRTDIINITSGYKGIIPHLTIFAQIHGLDIAYSYENSDVVAIIKPLPVSFDGELVETFAQYMDDSIWKNNDVRNPNYNPDITDELASQLMDYGLLLKTKTNKGTGYKISNLGKQLEQVATMHPASKNEVLGLFMEYKFYQYFNECRRIDNTKVYENIQRGVEPNVLIYSDGRLDAYAKHQKISEDQKTLGDIDVMMNSTNDKRLILCECKAINTFNIGNENELFDKMFYRIKWSIEYKHQTSIEFRFLLSIFDLKNDKSRENQLSKAINRLDNWRENLTNKKLPAAIKLTAYWTSIPILLKQPKVNYDRLLKNELQVVELYSKDI